ncbi:MAG: hypothetical protein KatS3mg044_0994 [Rhodothermaceae bacterium]|nr:MAG: hypothetical protein KatS3mg044_0994 [Rhodothermaceae bacterium]
MPVAFADLFSRPKPLIAMIHTGPSPGLPGFVCMESAVERAVAEAEVYLRAGVDGILVENMHDFPCVHEREMGPEVAAFMTRVAYAVKRRAGRTPVGLQVLFQANRTALAVALAAGCDFVRAEGWTYAHVADKGMAEACAGTVVRYRHHIRADHLPVFADVKKKHAAHALTADLSLADLARGMALHRADAVVVTGTRTGEPPSPDDLDAGVRGHVAAGDRGQRRHGRQPGRPLPAGRRLHRGQCAQRGRRVGCPRLCRTGGGPRRRPGAVPGRPSQPAHGKLIRTICPVLRLPRREHFFCVETTKHRVEPEETMVPYVAITDDIVVTVRPVYLDGRSDLMARKFVFGYLVRIENRGVDDVQLLRRPPGSSGMPAAMYRRWKAGESSESSRSSPPVRRTSTTASVCSRRSRAAWRGRISWSGPAASRFRVTIPRFDLRAAAN